MKDTLKLVIEIPEEVYELLKNFDWESLPKEKFDELASYEYTIAHGTPLPKGHGRLIDADAIEYDKESLETDSSQVFLVVDKDSIDLMPTIVEADKENDT